MTQLNQILAQLQEAHGDKWIVAAMEYLYDYHIAHHEGADEEYAIVRYGSELEKWIQNMVAAGVAAEQQSAWNPLPDVKDFVLGEFSSLSIENEGNRLHFAVNYRGFVVELPPDYRFCRLVHRAEKENKP